MRFFFSKDIAENVDELTVIEYLADVVVLVTFAIFCKHFVLAFGRENSTMLVVEGFTSVPLVTVTCDIIEFLFTRMSMHTKTKKPRLPRTDHLHCPMPNSCNSSLWLQSKRSPLTGSA